MLYLCALRMHRSILRKATQSSCSSEAVRPSWCNAVHRGWSHIRSSRSVSCASAFPLLRCIRQQRLTVGSRECRCQETQDALSIKTFKRQTFGGVLNKLHVIICNSNSWLPFWQFTPWPKAIFTATSSPMLQRLVSYFSSLSLFFISLFIIIEGSKKSNCPN